MLEHRSALLALMLVTCARASLAQSPATLPRSTEMTPLLPYLFFDAGSAAIPTRYHLLADSSETAHFHESRLARNPIAQHHDILNVIGARLRSNPATTIEITGNNSAEPDSGETIEVSAARAMAVRRYLTDVWLIDSARVTLRPARNLPSEPSNPRDPYAIIENRRVELASNDWAITRPVVLVADAHAIDPVRLAMLGEIDSTDWTARAARSAIGVYRLIRFKFGSRETGPLNDRAIREIIVRDVRATSRVVSLGMYDADPYEELYRIPRDRSLFVYGLLTSLAKAASMRAESINDRFPEFDNTFPEGRFYNRAVVIHVLTPYE
jgi:hypothetical protein